MVRTSVTHSAIASCAIFLFLPHFDVICDLLLNRRTTTWNLFVKHAYICRLHRNEGNLVPKSEVDGKGRNNQLHRVAWMCLLDILVKNLLFDQFA